MQEAVRHPYRRIVLRVLISTAQQLASGVMEINYCKEGRCECLFGEHQYCYMAAGFYDVTGGKITLGGTDITPIDSVAMMKDFSVVFQDVVLFNNTIMENIRVGRKNATDEEVVAAAKAAHCHDFIIRLPEGYQTVIGENGSTLSGGECQRLSIARA